MQTLRLLLIFFCSLCPWQAALARETITIVADEWCPYNCAEDAVKQGYMVEIARDALAKYDIDVVYKVMPWAVAIPKVRAGAFDAVVGANRGDTPDFIFPNMIQGISRNLGWVRNDSKWRYQGPLSLANQRVGVVEDYFYGKDLTSTFKRMLKENPAQIMVKRASDATEQNIEDLLAGHVDVIFEDENVVKYYFASRNLPMELTMAGNPINDKNFDDTYVSLAFGPNNPESKRYAKLLVEGTRIMKENGELEAILLRYHMDSNYRFPGENLMR